MSIYDQKSDYPLYIIQVAQHTTVETLIGYQWSYYSLALSHPYNNVIMLKCSCTLRRNKLIQSTTKVIYFFNMKMVWWFHVRLACQLQCSAKALEKWRQMTHTTENYGDVGNFSGVTYVMLPFMNLKFVGTWTPTVKIIGDIPDFSVLNVPKTQPRHNPAATWIFLYWQHRGFNVKYSEYWMEKW